MSDLARTLRRRASELHRIAEQLVREAEALERSTVTAADDDLGGRELTAFAVDVLNANGAVGPHHRGMHYTDILRHIEASTARRITGVDAVATLLANLGRDPRIESTQARSGRYRLAEKP